MSPLNGPNKVLRGLLEVEPKETREAKDVVVRREKEDLPFAKPLDVVALAGGERGKRVYTLDLDTADALILR